MFLKSAPEGRDVYRNAIKKKPELRRSGMFIPLAQIIARFHSSSTNQTWIFRCILIRSFPCLEVAVLVNYMPLLRSWSLVGDFSTISIWLLPEPVLFGSSYGSSGQFFLPQIRADSG